jgi:hypothetical protein
LLLTPGLLLRLFLSRGLGLLLLFLGLGFLLLFRLGLLLLFRRLRIFFVLVLLCVRGSNGSEKKEQNSRADNPKWLH